MSAQNIDQREATSGGDNSIAKAIESVGKTFRNMPLLSTGMGLLVLALILFGVIVTERANSNLRDKLLAQAQAGGAATAAHVGHILDDARRTLRSMAGLIHSRRSAEPGNDEVLITVAEQLNLDSPQTAALAIIHANGEAILLDRRYAGQRFDVSARPYYPVAKRSPVGGFSYGPPTRNQNTGSVNLPVMLKIRVAGEEMLLSTALVENDLQEYLRRIVPGGNGIAALIQRDERSPSTRIVSTAGPLVNLAEAELNALIDADTWRDGAGRLYQLHRSDVSQSPFVVVTGFARVDGWLPVYPELYPQTFIYFGMVALLGPGLFALLMVIGRNHLAGEQLRVSEQHYRDLIEGSLQGIFIHRNYRPLFVNEATLNILGYDSEREFLSLPSIEAFIAPFERQRLKDFNDARTRGEEMPSTYEFTAIRRDGSERMLLNAVRLIEWQGLPAVQCAVVDITEAHNLARRLAQEASQDELTKTYNRRAFLARLGQIIKTRPAEGRAHVLFVLDLDQFKVVNDACGHAGGDELLRQLTHLLRSKIRSEDMLARLGGDEFAVLLQDFPQDRIESYAQSLLDTAADYRFTWQGYRFKIGISIGVTPFQGDEQDIARLISKADTACYVAKENGRNRFHVYDDADRTTLQRQGDIRWIARFDKALAANDFFLLAQPIADLQDRSPGQHFELLLRMKDENGGTLSPASFLPTAERYQIASRIDRWVLNTALNWLQNSPQLVDSLYLCNINLSGQTLADSAEREYFVRTIGESSVPPEKLCFEVTETAAMIEVMTAIEFMQALRELGCSLALDDFGSGLSSFAYLNSLPVDFVKIDGQFVRPICDDPVNLAIVRAIHQLGQATGKKTVAEFVEDEKTLKLLQSIGVDFAQGYHIGKPESIGIYSSVAPVALLPLRVQGPG